jgi:hypothetical protein
MIEYILSQINAIAKAAHDTYGVNPIIFVIIYLGCTPIFYYSLFQTIRAVAKRLGNKIMLWSAIFLCVTIAPYVYVLLFGKNIPWWVYGIIGLVVGQAVLSLILKLRNKPINDPTTTDR